MVSKKEWDLFICHASEDKEVVARPLAEYLREKGYRVWYDEFSLQIGDSLLHKINEGIAGSKFGVIVLSHQFFAKQWTKKELGGLFAKEIAGGEKVLLPIWHGITHAQLVEIAPMLADNKALLMTDGLQKVARQIRDVIDEDAIPDSPPLSRDLKRDGLMFARTDEIYEITGPTVTFGAVLLDDMNGLNGPFQYNGYTLQVEHVQTLSGMRMPPIRGHHGPTAEGVTCRVVGTPS